METELDAIKNLRGFSEVSFLFFCYKGVGQTYKADTADHIADGNGDKIVYGACKCEGNGRLCHQSDREKGHIGDTMLKADNNEGGDAERNV